MPIIPSVPMTLSPEPGEAFPPPYPWRFRVGSTVYVKGHPLHDSFIVIGGELWLGFPHLYLSAYGNQILRVPQIHCSSKPITYRKG